MQLDEHLKTLGVSDDLHRVILGCCEGIYDIAAVVRTGAALGYAGSQNVFGEEQLKLDMKANEVLIAELKKVESIHMIASEEMSEEMELHCVRTDGKDQDTSCLGITENAEAFSVGFDPLDGSSLVDVNFSVGTIMGIYPSGSFIGKKPGEMYCAIVAVYGPRTTLFVAVKGKGAHQYLLSSGGFELQKERIQIADEGKYFAPGNLRACLKNPAYRQLMNYWLDNQYTLRYSGGMVPDINHILVKGKGIFTYPGYSDEPNGKLRLLYECGTMALLMTEAGGSASDGVISILDKPLEHLDQRTPVFLGSTKEVEKALEFFIMG